VLPLFLAPIHKKKKQAGDAYVEMKDTGNGAQPPQAGDEDVDDEEETTILVKWSTQDMNWGKRSHIHKSYRSAAFEFNGLFVFIQL
jgi:hypothetical protein